jgi:lipopolysaccharide transport system permease protein
MFLTPIFYPLSSVSSKFLGLYMFNPLTVVVEQTRHVLLAGLAPDGKLLVVYWIVSLVIAYSGFVFFQKTRQGFSDVL